MVENSLRRVSNKQARGGGSESFIDTLLILKFALLLPHIERGQMTKGGFYQIGFTFSRSLQPHL